MYFNFYEGKFKEKFEIEQLIMPPYKSFHRSIVGQPKISIDVGRCCVSFFGPLPEFP
jgi:hypothetical protein